MKGENRPRFRQVGAAVDTEDHDGVDMGHQFGDGGIERDAVGVGERGREAVHPVDAVGDVGAPALPSGDDPAAGDMIGVAGGVEQLRERDRVRGVGPDKADPEVAAVDEAPRSRPPAEDKGIAAKRSKLAAEENCPRLRQGREGGVE